MHPDSPHSDQPISAALVCWGNAWLTGHVGLDEAVDQIERTAGPGLVACPPPGETPGLPEKSGPSGAPPEVALRRFLADLRVGGMAALRLSLPAAGDPLGLTGPPAFNAAAIEAGEAAIAVLPDRGVGLIPAPDRRGSSYSGVRWTALDASPASPDLPSLSEAEHALSAAIRSATDTLMAVEGPRQAHPGSSLSGADEALAPGYPARAHRVAVLAARLATALRLADDRGLTSAQVTARVAALRDLDRAVRRARVAAHHAILESGRS